ncbi:Signal transduction histidine-protein kinase afsQ2 [Streptomyces albus]|uniref:histidine kinase n=1 Tax=Streptomyces albus (strain ATCC 21838 / DSM 41398 / FERM P-419 / JCM 4703 / NBRC 107858) TaxID=1081613 RepID=A0A0B5EUL0_STRA4|nr:Signal transduction histidine-protein kinase afsQ2 [Streptomyces albus]AOU79753.1 Signal transduction histidine-protein kinase afsQ2 [Streptomyces albus]AYN35477.1 Signal transduction histidine-protein kinase afsQ2 [Streptomyces albus]
MTALPAPEHSRVVLVGASRFEELAELPAVAANVATLRELFTSEEVWGLPRRHCLLVAEPRAPREVSAAVRQAAAEATDTLIVYYAGHGLIDPGTGELHLALRESRPHEVYDTAVPYDWIRRTLATSRATRRIVILDCCYSGRMLGAMSEGLGLAEIDGTYLLAAAAENALALAPPGELFTAFTGELVALVRSGVPGAGPALTLNDLYERTRSSLRAAGRPEPHCRDRNTLGAVPFVPNPAFQVSPEGEEGAPPADEPGTVSQLASIRRFMADLSHELRTPLTALTAVSDVLETDAAQKGVEMGPPLRLMVDETRRLAGLVENLMELARFDAGLARLVVTETDIAAVVRECLAARDWDRSVTVVAAPGVIAFLDPRRLDVIMANLIGNALAHGQEPVTVTVAVRPPPGEPSGPDPYCPDRPFEIVLTVADRGEGIPAPLLPYVFDRFRKGDSRRPRSAGHGLGLSFAQENARLMGGRVEAANQAEGGAVFTVRLPQHPHPEPSAPSEP